MEGNDVGARGAAGNNGRPASESPQSGRADSAVGEALTADDIAALNSPSNIPRFPRWAWAILVGLLIFISVFGALVWLKAEHNAALEDCRNAVSRSNQARSRLEKTLKTVASTSGGVTSSQVSQASVVTKLSATVSAASAILSKNPVLTAADACSTKSSTKSLKASTAAITAQTEAMRAHVDKVTKASTTVLASRDEKTLADEQSTLSALATNAKTLLNSTAAKTAETTYHEALSTEITAALALVKSKSTSSSSATALAKKCRESATSLQKAMDAVSASIEQQSGVDCDKLKCVALTFDDGPSAVNDSKLRDELDKLKVKATFFMIGKNITSSTSSNITRDVASGSLDGNHSWDHAQLSKLSTKDIASELSLTESAIVAAGGVSSGLVRPPYGAWNDDVRNVAAKRGEAIILWNVDSEDWKSLDAKKTTTTVVNNVSAGSIVLMHSIYASTVKAVPDIVHQLRSKGYTLVTVAQLLGGSPKPGWVYYSQHDMIHLGSTEQVEN